MRALLASKNSQIDSQDSLLRAKEREICNIRTATKSQLKAKDAITAATEGLLCAKDIEIGGIQRAEDAEIGEP